MPDDHNSTLARARVRAHGLTLWASFKAHELPALVRQFITQDLPFLLQIAGLPDLDDNPPGLERLTRDVADHHQLARLVEKVRLTDSAQNIPELWKACEADVAAAFGRLCQHRQRALLEIAVRELAWTGWSPDALAGDTEEAAR